MCGNSYIGEAWDAEKVSDDMPYSFVKCNTVLEREERRGHIYIHIYIYIYIFLATPP